MRTRGLTHGNMHGPRLFRWICPKRHFVSPSVNIHAFTLIPVILAKGRIIDHNSVRTRCLAHGNTHGPRLFCWICPKRHFMSPSVNIHAFTLIPLILAKGRIIDHNSVRTRGLTHSNADPLCWRERKVILGCDVSTERERRVLTKCFPIDLISNSYRIITLAGYDDHTTYQHGVFDDNICLRISPGDTKALLGDFQAFVAPTNIFDPERKVFCYAATMSLSNCKCRNLNEVNDITHLILWCLLTIAAPFAFTYVHIAAAYYNTSTICDLVKNNVPISHDIHILLDTRCICVECIGESVCLTPTIWRFLDDCGAFVQIPCAWVTSHFVAVANAVAHSVFSSSVSHCRWFVSSWESMILLEIEIAKKYEELQDRKWK